jgi:hypothetical protein
VQVQVRVQGSEKSFDSTVHFLSDGIRNLVLVLAWLLFIRFGELKEFCLLSFFQVSPGHVFLYALPRFSMIPSLNGDGGKLTTLRKMLHPLLLPKSDAVKKTGASYFALFRPLQDVQSRLILSAGVVLALAAGAPLPIIGVIFARIIDAFPPSEAEVWMRIYQLLAVGGLT